jgi:hypothetical protein
VTESTRTSRLHAVRVMQRALHDEELLLATVARLLAADHISAEQAERLRVALSGVTAKTNYIIRNLAVHLGIGASKVVLPLPIGGFLRGSWVVLARATETVRRRPDHASIHSLPVFLISCVPFAGYLGYIVALRRHDPDAALLYANHISILRYDQPLEDVLRTKPLLIQRIVRRAVGTSPE